MVCGGSTLDTCIATTVSAFEEEADIDVTTKRLQ